MFNWFGRKSAPAARFAVPWLQGRETGFAAGYEAQLDEVYRRNPVGLRAVRLVADAVSGLAIVGDERGLVKPSLLERVTAGVLQHGNAYVQLITDGRDAPAELHALRPERVSVVPGADGWPAAYAYRAGTQETRLARTDPLGRRQVAHLRSLDPADDHYGLGCLDAAIAAASVHNGASRWNKALLDNAARPSGALVYENDEGANLSNEQFDRLKAELAEQFAGSANAGRPLILDGGLKWQALSLSPAELDFAAQGARCQCRCRWQAGDRRSDSVDRRAVGGKRGRRGGASVHRPDPRGATRPRPHRNIIFLFCDRLLITPGPAFAAFGQQRVEFPRLRSNRRSHNVFGQFY
ncbi:phage portal protein [Sphingomonas rhizophila]|uniref:Phage portal protein n=1 Tax=Sphingomonas rhizophila TaxID=2071607 RepID=A0A7G9SCE8_9SPHN|nr:phage portal protein [Sphingomonas rhizophila]QNN65523.1 phage portal protein [Sphingomonas rhizophila]